MNIIIESKLNERKRLTRKLMAADMKQRHFSNLEFTWQLEANEVQDALNLLDQEIAAMDAIEALRSEVAA